MIRATGIATTLPFSKASRTRSLLLVIGAGLIAAPAIVFGQNMDCTLIVPSNPLTAQGLATPYQMVATNAVGGPCNETNKSQSAFVQAAVIDAETGAISIYNPLVVDKGTAPATPPVVPKLPDHAVVAIWFGFNAGSLTLVGADSRVLESSFCQQNLGQFAYCNAPAFFAVAGFDILFHKLQVPELGTGKDNRPCPSVRSFAEVDQDQSDNVTTTYLVTASGTLAQSTAANLAKFPGAASLANPSDNRLTDIFLDPALGCTPWTAPDLADPGHMVPALPLNELQAAVHQTAPVALVPLGDPFTLNSAGQPDLANVNRYRLGVAQFMAFSPADASTKEYCANFRSIASEKLILDQPFFTAFRSPFPNMANSLFTFMAQRFSATYQILNCKVLLNQPDPVTLTTSALGIVTGASIRP
jgi:hypothetical protein